MSNYSRTRRRNVQSDHLSFFFLPLFFTTNVGHYRGQQPTAFEIKRTSPKGPVWIRFQGQFAERRVSRGICGPPRSLCARLKSNNEHGIPCAESRVGKVYTVFPWGVGLTDCQTLLARGIARVTGEIPGRIVPVISVSSSNSSRLTIRGISTRRFLQEASPEGTCFLYPLRAGESKFHGEAGGPSVYTTNRQGIIHTMRTLRRQKSRKLVPRGVCLLLRRDRTAW